MKLFRRKSKCERFFTINDGLSRAYHAIPSFLFQKNFGALHHSIYLEGNIWREYVIDSTQCINKAILCPRNNDVDHISEEDRNKLHGQVKTDLSVHSYTLQR